MQSDNEDHNINNSGKEEAEETVAMDEVMKPRERRCWPGTSRGS